MAQRSPLDDASANTSALTQFVYDELCQRARRLMRFEPKNHTLEPPATRADLMRLTSLAMRRVLVDRARRVRRDQRQGGRKRLDLAEIQLEARGPTCDALDLDEVLRRLEARDEGMAAVVTLHYVRRAAPPGFLSRPTT